MNKTFSAFFQFVKDDPIMMGLCLAIGVLVILFIIVLLLGKKSERADKKEEQVMKTQVDLNVIKDASSSVKDNPILNSQAVTDKVEPIPVEMSEPVKLEASVSSIEGPSLDKEPYSESEYLFNRAYDSSVTDNLSSLTAVETAEPKVPSFDRLGNIKSEIIESSVSPVESTEEKTVKSDFPNFLDVKYTDEKNTSFPKLSENPLPTIEKPNSPVIDDLDAYRYDPVDLPEVKLDDFSKTEIIKNVSSPSSNETRHQDIEEDDDDIVLPKLNTVNQSNSAFDIMGESFDVPKNS